jgi:hypothetical protein
MPRLVMIFDTNKSQIYKLQNEVANQPNCSERCLLLYRYPGQAPFDRWA